MANLAELSEFWARWRPDAVAMTQDGVAHTWAGLEERTRRVAVGLLASGVEQGDRVGVLGLNALSWCELALGVLRAGAVVVPLNIRCTASELAHMVDLVTPAAVAYDAALAERLDPVRRPGLLRIALDGHDVRTTGADLTLDELAGHGDALDPAIADRLDGDAPAVVSFTSGTTGYPKGAVLTHGNVLATADNYARWEGWGAGTAMLCCVPLAFTGGIINNFLVTHCVGGTLILAEFDPARALELIVGWPVTAMTGVPIMYESIAAVPGFDAADLSALGTAITGGALVGEPMLRRYEAKGVRIRQAYSLTEATASTTLLPADHFLARRATAGLPAPHTRVQVVDDERVPLPAGRVGEIAVHGPQVCAGYWGDPEATSAAISDGWLYTGDMGVLDTDGFLSVVDRKKDMIISGGLNVYPAEVERVIAEFPGVTEVAAVPADHERWGETVAVVVGGDDGLDLDALYAHCREHLADYKVPRWLSRAEAPLPRGMSGKVQRRVVRERWDPATARRTAAR